MPRAHRVDAIEGELMSLFVDIKTRRLMPIHDTVYPIIFSELLLYIYFLIAFVYGSMITAAQQYHKRPYNITISRLCLVRARKYIRTERRRRRRRV